MIQRIRKFFKMPDRKLVKEAQGKVTYPKKGDRFVYKGWVFQVAKINERGMISTPLGIVQEKPAEEPSRIIYQGNNLRSSGIIHAVR
jgi:hypothetical protein